MGVAMECVREDPAGTTLAPPPQPRNEAGRQTSRNLTLPAAASQSAYRFARLNAALRRHCCSSVQTKERRGNIEAVEAAVKRRLLRCSLSRCQMPDGWILDPCILTGIGMPFWRWEMVAEGVVEFHRGPSGVTSARLRSELLQHFRQPSCSGCSCSQPSPILDRPLFCWLVVVVFLSISVCPRLPPFPLHLGARSRRPHIGRSTASRLAGTEGWIH